ncbi:MAG: type II toxin-antitoxin system RelE/ParE family toxin [Tardiphaga sp.]|nr:type II toxin-antitoxin system RelE/ParE family toxin [Tardiphaga sp.]
MFARLLQHSPASARSVAQRLLRRARFLQDYPSAGIKSDVSEIRRLAVVNYPYVILCTINRSDDEVLIVNVYHTGRKPSPAED